jgi:LTXXQ motif family protein
MPGTWRAELPFYGPRLKITDGQSPQWNAFAEALRANARRMTEMHGMMGQGASQSAPERLDRMEKMMAACLRRCGPPRQRSLLSMLS